MISKVFTWCISNMKATILILGFLLTAVFVPTLKEAVAFINAGYESTKINNRQDRQIEEIKKVTMETKTSLQSIERLLKDEFQYRRKGR